MAPENRRAWAALDLGTSRLKAGVFDGRRFAVVGSVPAPVRYGGAGRARCAWDGVWRGSEELLRRVGAWCAEYGATQLDLGLCGQVSSLLAWDPGKGAPVENEFPIWADSTCRGALEETTAFLSGGRDLDLLGTPLPLSTNWLLVKLRGRGARPDGVKYLQVHDAVFARLTGLYHSHPSGQISLVDQRTGEYSAEALDFAGVDRDALPLLAGGRPQPLKDEWAKAAGLPPATRVHPGLADMSAAFGGLDLAGGEGFCLANTSEIMGFFADAPPTPPPARLVTAPVGAGWVSYGSTASGGHTVGWLLKEVLRCGEGDLPALMAEAEEVAPGCDGLLCLPYLAGERAPLWDPDLSGAFVGLRADHGRGHLVRAVLEGVAFGRRQLAEAFGRPMPAAFKLAGGGSANPLWNGIRAAVLERPLAVCGAEELSLLGALRLSGARSGQTEWASLLDMRRLEPDPGWTAVYKDIYPRFLALQRALRDPERPGPEGRA